MSDNWQLVLEQQSDLSIKSGSTAAVAEAVRAGDAFAGIMSHHHSYVYDGQPIAEPYVSLFKYDTSGRISHVKWMLGDRAIDVSAESTCGVHRWYVCRRWRSA